MNGIILFATFGWQFLIQNFVWFVRLNLFVAQKYSSIVVELHRQICPSKHWTWTSLPAQRSFYILFYFILLGEERERDTGREHDRLTVDRDTI